MSDNAVRTIGIPRSLLFYEYGVLWQRFFEELGFQVVVSPPTDRAIFERGEAASVDEVCLASKTFMGHVAALAEGDQCDALFVPSFDNSDIRVGFCTKYQALPDLVRATFPQMRPQLVTMRVQKASDKKRMRADYLELARRLGANPRQASRAYKRALHAQEASDAARAKAQQETLALLAKYRKVVASDRTGTEQPPLAILLVAHPYIAHDPYIAGDIVAAIERLGATVLFADEADRTPALKRSFEFSETLPWMINRHLAGAVLQLHEQVDGIVLLSAFPCGPDSMFDDAIMRNVQGVPILNLMIDAQSGSAGTETRLESFIDILRFQGKGSYLHD
ncbi:acyl-CoA dehydratase activase-related protein [Adlercreutzia murintestinalis]|uniref:acyl-CoA dehydratase activase-related protein n=1 Tax=Adlercreutzia murintestinalis TaxID=2941325 RepID=UPI00203A4664|nr:acyl-CoA dehydratase activase-related protein [Adlercreutzia murintestinalis]